MKTLASTGGAAVQLEGIRKSYGGNEVLKGIDIEVPAGSFTTFLGPSGSGKTTTLAITTGLVGADAGSVRIGGTDCTRTPVNRRNLGFVFQSYALFPHMTIEKNIAFPLRLRKLPRSEVRQRVGEALELVHLEGYGKRYPSQLSGGQQQRIAVARAVVFHPRVLLMDEPLGALDAALRAHLQREIVRIGRELGVTILYVTHDQDEALSMSDQVVLFQNGAVEQAGSPREVYTAPRTEFAASFIGGGALLAGRLDRRQQPVVVTAAGQCIPVDADSVRRHGLQSGHAAAAVVRPECVQLGAGPEDATIGTGTVVDVIYNGALVRVRVELAGDATVECHCRASAAASWRLGDEATVAIDRGALPVVVPSTVSLDVATELTPAPTTELSLAVGT